MSKKREILICSTPRSGSTILAEAMYATASLGRPDEYFNNNEQNKGDMAATLFAQNWSELGATSFEDYCEKLHAKYQSANGVHSVKLHFTHFYHALKNGYFRRNVDWQLIYIYREDLRAQAASLAIAIQTQRWNSRMAPVALSKEFEISDDLLARCYHSLVMDNLRWQANFKMFNITPLTLEYNELTSNIRDTIEDIAARVGVDIPTEKLETLVSKLTTKKQASEKNLALIDRLNRKMTLGEFGPGNLLYDTGVLFPKKS